MHQTMFEDCDEFLLPTDELQLQLDGTLTKDEINELNQFLHGLAEVICEHLIENELHHEEP